MGLIRNNCVLTAVNREAAQEQAEDPPWYCQGQGCQVEEGEINVSPPANKRPGRRDARKNHLPSSLFPRSFSRSYRLPCVDGLRTEKDVEEGCARVWKQNKNGFLTVNGRRRGDVFLLLGQTQGYFLLPRICARDEFLPTISAWPTVEGGGNKGRRREGFGRKGSSGLFVIHGLPSSSTSMKSRCFRVSDQQSFMDFSCSSTMCSHDMQECSRFYAFAAC
jgi:hypothetical protein